MRALISIFSSALVVVGSATAMTVAGPAAPARAAANYDCGAVYSLQGADPRNMRQIDTSNGNMTNNGAFDISGSGSLNALGLSNDGSKAFGVLPGNNNSRTVYAYDRASGATEKLGEGVATSNTMTHGAVNPKTGIYYYGGFSSTGNGTGNLRIYGFNTVTKTSLGLVAEGSIAAGGGNGDWAFDQQGNMFVVGGNSGDNRVSAINQTLPSVGGSKIDITGTLLTQSDANDAINGIAFAGDGYLYLASGSRLFKVNPSNGDRVATYNLNLSGSVDLASCASPNTVSVVKDFPNGRVAPTDQATLKITGGDITTGNTGTTEGNDSGLQDQPSEIAGPVLALTGKTYTVTETGSAIKAPGYVSSYICVDQNSGATLTSGTGTSGTFTMPPGGTKGVAAKCTFTNVAQIPGIELDKQAGAATGNKVGDTITYKFVVKNTGNVPLATVTVDDPKVGTVTCPPGVLAPGASKTCTAPAYTLTQADITNGKVDNTATATGTPSTPGLPTVKDDDTTTTPIAQIAKLVLEKLAGAPVDVNKSGLTDAGDTVQYSFSVTNDGNLPITGLHIVDPLVGATTCEVTDLAVGASTTCVADNVYVITTADETAGKVVNTAHAEGKRPNGGVVPSNDDSTTTPVQKPSPKLAIEKKAGTPVDVNASGITDAGDTVAYTFTVTNTGNVPLTSINVSDPLAGAVTCEETSLKPGESTECVADALYTITEADESAGQVVNTAIAEGEDPNGGDVDSPPDSTTTKTQTPAPELALVKEAGTPVDVNDSGITDAGDTIAYTFTVTNKGNVPVHAVEINDPLAGAATCELTSLEPGESTTCVADEAYTITKDDESNGTVENTAVAEGLDPDDEDVISDPDSTVTPVDEQAAALELTKKAGTPVDVNKSGLTDAGDTVAYTFTLTNSGNVPLHDLTITDPLVGAITCEATTLAKGASTQCAADEPYTITEADETAGKVVNVANANGVDPDGDDTPSNEASTTTPVDQPNPALTLDKKAGTPVDVNGSGITDAGDTIDYTFLVTNSGNVPLTNVKVKDPKVGTLDCPKTELAPGASMLCTASTYTITEDDEAGGSVVNVAEVTGDDPDGDPVDPPEDTTTTEVETPEPKLEIEKRAGAPVDVNNSGITDAGDTIAYTFTVTNSGNVPMSNIKVKDPKAGAVTCEVTTLKPGESTECKADKAYVVTEADEDAGNVHNTATVTGEDPDGDPSDPSDPGETDTPTEKPVVKLVLDKSAGTPVDDNLSGITDAGDTIAYTFTVTNSGNVPVQAIAVVDPKAGAVTCEVTTLKPGESTECEADEPYTVTEADEKSGSADNVAHATGVDPDGEPTKSNDDDTTTPVDTPAPKLEIEKRAGAPVDVNDSGITDAGDTIAYTFTVTNTGNVPMSNIKVSDPKAGAVTCEETTLKPGESTECKADEPYVVTEADELAGNVHNTATTTGEDPDGDPSDPSDPGETDTPAEKPEPHLSLVKKAGTPVDVNDSGITDAGDTIQFTFTVTNDGNVPVSKITVNDPLAGAVTCEVTTLKPGESTECKADEVYKITKDDEAAEIVRNTATTEGEDPDGDPTDPSDPSTTTTPTTPQAPAITLEKHAADPVDVNKSGITDAGDTIAYTFTVTNDGNVPVFDVKVTDPIAGSVTCPPGRLAKGESVECAADAAYVVTEADEDAGKVVNVAHANATDPDGDDVESNEDTTTTPTTKPNPSLLVDKEAGDPVDTNGNGVTDAGDTITFTFTVTNDGNVPLTKVEIDDPMLGDSVTCEATELAPGAVTTCAADYALTQADVDNGEVKNTATAIGEDPDKDPVESPEDSTETPIEPAPALSLVKKATLDDKDGDDRADVGETIQWSFTVTNDGNVTLKDVKVDDPMAGAVTCEATELAPGKSIECQADAAYVVTQADVDSGQVHNVATASGVPPKGDEVPSDPSETTTPTDSRTALVLDKSNELVDKDGDEKADAGEKIRYTFEVTNTGTVTVDGISIDDDMLADAGVEITCKATKLAPGESTTCTAVYTVTDKDVDADKVVNVATANGCASTPVAGRASDKAATCANPVTSNEDDTTTPADNAPAPKDPEDPKDPNGPFLPNTGGPLQSMLWLGLVLLLGGSGAMFWTRRRRA
ncbi:hypothetical protein ASG90_00825 [Nocardioides sp. Soil797]|nr:hypothetical protein ASG90_00825 [Nocardioides sp. Soil797]